MARLTIISQIVWGSSGVFIQGTPITAAIVLVVEPHSSKVIHLALSIVSRVERLVVVAKPCGSGSTGTLILSKSWLEVSSWWESSVFGSGYEWARSSIVPTIISLL